MKKYKLFEAELFLKGETDEYFEVGGLASTDDRDLQDEIIEQNGLDLSGLVKRQIVFNDDHSKETKDVIGLVENAKVTNEGLVVKGKVFKNNPAGMTYYNLLKHGGYVGFSVEGAVLQRDQLDKSRIKKAKLTAIALTRNPVNTKTYAKFCKSLTSTEEVEYEEAEMTLESKVDQLVEMVAELAKGGHGSGRKPGGGAGTPQQSSYKDSPKAISDKKTDQKVDAVAAAAKQISDDEPAKQRQDHSEQKRQEMKTEIKNAKAHFKGPELKAAIAVIKRKFFGNKVRVAKSMVWEEVARRAKENPEFAKTVLPILKKALSSGGPAYAENKISDFKDGQCFQMEGKEDKKKKKDDKDLNILSKI